MKYPIEIHWSMRAVEAEHIYRMMQEIGVEYANGRAYIEGLEAPVNGDDIAVARNRA